MGPVRQLAILASILAGPAAAQNRPEPVRLGGITFDHWQQGGAALLRPTLRSTTLPRGRPGLDLALVVFPDGFSIYPPQVIVGLQAGLAQRIPVGPVSMVLKGGVAGIATAAFVSPGQFFRLIPGVHGGLGLLVPVEKRASLRFDLTRHVYTSDGRTVGLWSFGAGFAVALNKP